MSATIHGLKKASTYSIIVDGVILKTFTVDQSIPFSTEKIIDHNQVCPFCYVCVSLCFALFSAIIELIIHLLMFSQISLAGQNSIFKKSAFILTDGEHAVAAGKEN